MYLLIGFTGFSKSFLDVAQNFMTATYKEAGGKVGCGLSLPFRPNRTSCVPEKLSV